MGELFLHYFRLLFMHDQFTDKITESPSFYKQILRHTIDEHILVMIHTVGLHRKTYLSS